MKKINILLIVILLLTSFTVVNQNVEAASNITINVAGVKQSYSNKAIIKSGSTLVPLRGIFESLGATVQWNQSTKTIDASKGNTKIWLKIGSKTTKVNGKTVTIAVPAQIVNGSTLVPLRFISEVLGANVQWTQASKTIDITPAKGSSKTMKIHFIDVGQGDATLIQSPNGKNILIDGGPRSEGNQLVAYIKSLGISKLDYVVATHPDADHIGGLIAVLNSISVSKFINSGKDHTSETYMNMLYLISSKNIPYTEPSSGTVVMDENNLEFYLKVIYANKNATENNEASLVIKGGYCGTDVLLMGDAGLEVENILLKSANNLKVDLLKVGHHGSSSSSSLNFLKAVNPEATILSYGKDNSYGHPHQTVLNNINTVGSKMYSTATEGTIIATIDCNGYKLNAKEFSGGNVAPPTVPSKTYQNCTELRIDYPSGVPASHPAYQAKMDRDQDGWACE